MSLCNPTPGELYDRLCIVKLKIHHLRVVNKTKEQKEFIGEQYDLNVALQKWNESLRSFRNLAEKVAWGSALENAVQEFVNVQLSLQSQAFTELQHVHNRLWELEDDRRALIKQDTKDEERSNMYFHYIGVNAVETTNLNDKRSLLIQQINKMYGIETMEKLYELSSSNATDNRECVQSNLNQNNAAV